MMRDVGNLWVFILNQKNHFAHIMKGNICNEQHVARKRTCHLTLQQRARVAQTLQ